MVGARAIYLSRDNNILGGVKFLGTPQVHGLLQERDHIGIESLPVGVLQVVLLALDGLQCQHCGGGVYHVVHSHKDLQIPARIARQW